MEKIKKNKKGWIRIVEAVTAILIIISVVVIFASRTADKSDVSSTIQQLEKSVLDEVASNTDLRKVIVSDVYINDRTEQLRVFVLEKLPAGLKNSFAVCISEQPNQICKPSPDIISAEELAKKQVFVDDRIIFEDGKTKKIAIYIWLK